MAIDATPAAQAVESVPDGSRRRLVAAGVTLLSAPLWPATSYGAAPRADTHPSAQLMSAWAEREAGGALQHRAGQVAGAGIAVPQRAHGIARDPLDTNAAYVVARRPGTYLWRIDARNGALLSAAEHDAEYRYEGHVVVDAARGRVYATESHVIDPEGCIGVYDAVTLQRLAMWRSGGIGPHELLQIAPDVLAVANGGILTLPETGRVKRNLATMQPRLALIGLRDGRVMQTFALPQQHAGIRHLAWSEDGTLGVALQLEEQLTLPLLAMLRGDVLRSAQPQRDLAQDAVRYGAAIAACGDRFAISCPQNDRVQLWDSTGVAVGSVSMLKPSGITVRDGAFVVSSETGVVARIDARTLGVEVDEGLSRAARLWDNHMV